MRERKVRTHGKLEESEMCKCKTLNFPNASAAKTTMMIFH